MKPISSINTSIKIIAKNKKLFALLFLLQLFFIIAISMLFVKYTTDISTNAKFIFESMQESDFTNPNDITDLYDNPDEIYNAYTQMLKDILIFFIISYLIYILINGISWNISNYITTKNIAGKKLTFDYHLIFTELLLIFTIPLIFIVNIILKIFVNLQSANLTIILSAAIILITLYFMYISFALIDKTKTGKTKLKPLLKQTFRTGTKQFKNIAPAYLIVIFLLAMLIILISLSLKANFILLIFLCLCLMMSIIWARIYLLTTIKDIK